MDELFFKIQLLNALFFLLLFYCYFERHFVSKCTALSSCFAFVVFAFVSFHFLLLLFFIFLKGIFYHNVALSMLLPYNEKHEE